MPRMCMNLWLLTLLFLYENGRKTRKIIVVYHAMRIKPIKNNFRAFFFVCSMQNKPPHINIDLFPGLFDIDLAVAWKPNENYSFPSWGSGGNETQLQRPNNLIISIGFLVWHSFFRVCCGFLPFVKFQIDLVLSGERPLFH